MEKIIADTGKAIVIDQKRQRCDLGRRAETGHGGSLRHASCVTNRYAEASAPVIYGLALSTPAVVVNRLVDALIRYRRRIGTRWRTYTPLDQAILTCAWLDGGHTYRSLGEGNGVPKSTCRTLMLEGIKMVCAARLISASSSGVSARRVLGSRRGWATG